MEKKTLPSPIFCPLHVSQTIQKIDSRLEASQHGYCSDCILESEDPKSLAKSLISISQFLSDAAIFYTTHQSLATPAAEIPGEYAEVLSAKAENLEKLTKHIDEQKKSVENIFTEITKVVLEVIVQKKNSYLQMLNDQIVNITGRYNSFEKELKKRFPKQEDLEFLYPSKEELERRLVKVESASQLATFIKGIKDDIAQNCPREFGDKQDEKKQLTALSKELNEAVTKQPTFHTKSLILNDLVIPVKGILDQFLSRTLFLKDSVPSPTIELQVLMIDSKIIESKNWIQIKNWLPEKYKSLKPNLLYRSTQDGLQQQIFHNKCDGKGATITLVKCQFNGAQSQSIIGGFSDQNWRQNPNGYLHSQEAFIFSLTKQVKCNITNPANAVYCHPNYGPTFGGHDIGIMCGSSTNSFVNLGSNCYSLGNCGFGEGNMNGNCPFQLQELEVYNLV